MRLCSQLCLRTCSDLNSGADWLLTSVIFWRHLATCCNHWLDQYQYLHICHCNWFGFTPLLHVLNACCDQPCCNCPGDCYSLRPWRTVKIRCASNYKVYSIIEYILLLITSLCCCCCWQTILHIHRVKWRHIFVVAMRSPFCRSTGHTVCS